MSTTSDTAPPEGSPDSSADIAAADSVEGGCFCGAVRYRVRAVFDAGYCHCSVCRRISGAAAACWFSVREEDFEVVTGQPAALRSSEHFTRYFCAACGTHLYGSDDLPAPLRVGSRLVSAMLGTLDAPGSVAPRMHQWWGDHLDWFGDAASLPTFATGRIPHPDDRAALAGARGAAVAAGAAALEGRSADEPRLPAGAERRRQERRPFRGSAQLRMVGAPAMAVRTFDISMSGLGVLAPVSLPAGMACVVSVSLPTAQGTYAPAEIAAKVIHSVLAGGDFKVGLQFTVLSVPLAQAIARALGA